MLGKAIHFSTAQLGSCVTQQPTNAKAMKSMQTHD